VNTPIFTDLTIKENIYLLGLLWADGNLYKTTIELALKSEDFEYVKHIFNDFGYDKFEVRQRKRSGKPFGKKQTRIRITDKFIAEFLRKYDFDKKSQVSPLKILSGISKKNQFLWWRGYFDGDGCFYASKGNVSSQFTVWGSLNQDWGELINLYDTLNVHYLKYEYRRKKNKHKSSCVIVSNKNDIEKIGLYIYSSYDYVGFDRKYDKWEYITQTIPTPIFQYRQSNQKGVHFSKWYGKWIVRKTIKGKRKNVGSFSNYEKAVGAYKSYE
jgi:hypothetical protein